MKKILLSIFFLVCNNVLYAKETITIFFPYSAGSTTDIIIRKIAAKLENEKYKFIVVPTPGAGGLLAVKAMKNNKNNSLAVVGNGLLTFDDINIEKDIKLITFLGYEPTLITVSSKSTYQTLEDLHKESKNKQITFGSSGVGSYGHYSSSIIANNNKNFTHVPYKNTGSAVPDLLTERIDFLVMDESLFKRVSPNNQLRVIAANYSKRLKNYPNAKTLKEQGIDNLNFYRWEIIISNPDVDENLVKYLSNYFSSKEFLEDLEDNNLIFENIDTKTFFKHQQSIIKRIEDSLLK